MERSNTIKPQRWNTKRSTSIVLFGLALIAMMYVGKTTANFVFAWIEHQELTGVKVQMEQENAELTETNNRLQDSEYFSIYTQEGYQYTGDNIIILP